MRLDGSDAQTSFYYGDDISLTADGKLLVGSPFENPAIFDAELHRTGTLAVDGSRFVAVSPAFVPEPSSLLMLGLGVIGVAIHSLRGRRRLA